MYDPATGSSGPEDLTQDRVKSVTTFSTPHYGTGLVHAPLPAWTQGQPVTGRALLDLAHLAGNVALSRDKIWTRIRFGLATTFEGNALAFLRHLLHDDGLAKDLHPAVIGA